MNATDQPSRSASAKPVVMLVHGRQLATSPVITVPTITPEGDANGAPHPEPAAYRDKFAGRYEHRTITGGIGHNLPQAAPQASARAVIDVASY